MTKWRSLFFVATTLVGSACVGTIGDGGGESSGTSNPSTGSGSNPTSFVCDEALEPEAVPLRRLTQRQYRHTIEDLTAVLLPTSAATVWTALEPTTANIPEDIRVGRAPEDKHYAGYTRRDQALHDQHVAIAYEVGEELGAAATATPARMAEAFGLCASNADTADDDACLDAFIRSFGERVLRRTVSDEDVAFYRGPAGTAPFDDADYADVVTLLLSAPQLMYFVEHGQDGTGNVAETTAFELASRLSYHFWQTLPDEELFAVARDGSLLDAAVYQAQAERIFRDPRTRRSLGEFFAEWLDNTTLYNMASRVGTPIFDSFRGDFTPSVTLREEMLQEVVDSALYYSENAGTFEEFITSDRSFARTQGLADIYGTPVWTEGTEPPVFTEPERNGLITRAAYVATGSANTRPIMKGVFIRKALLCDRIDPPPPNAAAEPPSLSPDSTTREVVEELTGSGNCQGCHTAQINPLGFMTENFDALGRVRTQQELYDENGAVVATRELDTSGVPFVEDGDQTSVDGVDGFMNLLLASEKPASCFTRQYFRFTFARLEDDQRDGCVLKSVKDSVSEGRPLADALLAIALEPNFRKRVFE